jgi:ribosome-binding protein aMBF1 (putative translation factor)
MMSNEKEFQRAQQLLAATKKQIAATTHALQQQGMDQSAIDDLLVSLKLTCQQMEAELTWYEDAKAQRLGAYTFENIGQLLIGLRIAMGLSRRDLASRLGVHESVVSRDEHHEYLRAHRRAGTAYTRSARRVSLHHAQVLSRPSGLDHVWA